jgi:hypothetical protein
MTVHLSLLAVAVLISTVLSHTWNEQLSVIENGLFVVGSNGYPRGYVC